MAHLPEERLLIFDKPFVSTGADFFGQFLLKHLKTTRRKQVFTK